MSAYWELLRDPRWQRKRLEIMQRDNFACVDCGETDKTLNVHHTYYAKGRKPWEYEDESLKTLCEPCHKSTERALADLRRLIGQLEWWDRNHIEMYIRLTFGMLDSKDGRILVRDDHEAIAVAACYGVMHTDVLRLRDGDGYVMHTNLRSEAQRRLGQWIACDLDDARRAAGEDT